MARPRASRRRRVGYVYGLIPIAARLGCHADTARRYLTERRRGKPRLRGKIIGAEWMASEAEIDRFLREWPTAAADAESHAPGAA